MEQVLSVYERSYDEKHPVVCLDESPNQLLQQAEFIGQDGCQYQDSEYVRHGVCDIYMAFEPLSGKRVVSVEENHNRFTWVKVVACLLEEHYPDCEHLTIVQDNLSAHKPSAFYEVFTPQKAKAYLDRITFVFTPVHGSWLNMAEIELSVLQADCLDRPIGTIDRLQLEVNAWQQSRNNKQAKANWQFTNKNARIKLRKLYPTS